MSVSEEEFRATALRILEALIRASPPTKYGELESMTFHAALGAKSLMGACRVHYREEPRDR